MLKWSPTGTTAAAMNGRYRLMVGVTITATTSSATFYAAAKYGSGGYASFDAETTFAETVAPSGTQKFLWDFGIVEFTRPVSTSLTMAPYVELLAGCTSTTATKTIRWDFLYLVPADEAPRAGSRALGGAEDVLLGVGAVPGSVAKAYGIVQPFSCHVHPVVVGEQAQVHKRVGLLKVPQPWQQPAHGERAHHAHGQHFARPVFANLFQCRLHACEGIAQRGQQRQPLVRQCQAPG